MKDSFTDLARNPPVTRLLLWSSRHLPLRVFKIMEVVIGADIPFRFKQPVSIPHPRGIVIHGRAVIGRNCLIYQNVTIGSRAYDDPPPTIGDNVVIGAGAILLGPIQIGSHSTIGAGAVVLGDVPAGATVVGNPARLVNGDLAGRRDADGS